MCLCRIQLNRFFLRIFPTDIIKGEIVALIDHHGICLDVELVADLGERINIVVHGINQLLLDFIQAILSAS